ncbi:TetR/AcrR family transcriptional regulator [Sphingobium sp. CR2-8]|uniref:TetR/AcrR family transcriptional regulator n=1 Tax=Sphingobium sp. CR2-8 TaxID=1306534 RepID=UPI002DBB2A2A|nr:TetR/AcrR family transcriptional regulator [Sphingobium sp. CR2-8]MEC3909302.1 TetR/AcrR family transcriptional regulator [Sphingobium sp. CR2-8]
MPQSAAAPEPPSAAAPSPFRNKAERAREREEKREAVLLAAVRMFNARGYHATSLDDVAASLGVSKPTIYHYLGHKEQVLVECVNRGLSMLREAADAATAAPGSGHDRLRDFLIRYACINMDDFGRCVIRTNDEVLSMDSAIRFRARKREIDDAVRGLIAEGIADGSIAPVDVRFASFALAGALNWPARWHDPAGPMTSRQVAEKLVDIALGGLTPRG